MTTWHRHTGDVKDTVDVALYGIEEITGATVAGHVRKGATKAALVGTIVDAAAVGDTPCSIRVQLGATAGQPWLPTAAVGTWEAEWQLTFGDGTVLTWPDEEFGPDAIVVKAQRDP